MRIQDLALRTVWRAQAGERQATAVVNRRGTISKRVRDFLFLTALVELSFYLANSIADPACQQEKDKKAHLEND